MSKSCHDCRYLKKNKRDFVTIYTCSKKDDKILFVDNKKENLLLRFMSMIEKQFALKKCEYYEQKN